MTDVRIINRTNLAGIWADWLQLKDGTLDTTQELVNVVKVALLTDALADLTEILPDPDSSDRKGWWGDLDADTVWNGWPIGCKCWLLKRAKITPAEASEGSTLVRAETYVRQALQPMIDNQICSAFDVIVQRIGTERIDVLVTVYRGPQEDIQLQFQNLWSDIREQ
jgi:phage gp46-like protein